MSGFSHKVFMAAARRTAVSPRGGAFAQLEVSALAAPVLKALAQCGAGRTLDIDAVILGNALYGGGNPARVCALAAGLDVSVPAMTVDTQCCAGLDAISIGAAMIASGQAQAIIAGGVESYSRSPIRAHRPITASGVPVTYERPPFTPWPEADPDMVEAGALLAGELEIARSAQEIFAVQSHAKACAAQARIAGELVTVQGVTTDSFTRPLKEAACKRFPALAGGDAYALTSATIAVEADAAAAVLLVNESVLESLSPDHHPVEWVAGVSRGGDPTRPGLTPISAGRELLVRSSARVEDLAVVEIMEAFAVQAMAFTDMLAVPDGVFNRGGGALARGHPIGASGAILAVRLFHELQQEKPGSAGLAAIAAAGGLGSAALLRA